MVDQDLLEEKDVADFDAEDYLDRMEEALKYDASAKPVIFDGMSNIKGNWVGAARTRNGADKIMRREVNRMINRKFARRAGIWLCDFAVVEREDHFAIV